MKFGNIVILFLIAIFLIPFGVYNLKAAEFNEISGSEQTVIKVTSTNPNEKVSVGMAYRTDKMTRFLQKETPFEEKFEAEFISGSFLKLSGDGEIKVEITENSISDSNKKRFYVWGEGDFINIKSESAILGKRFRVSTNDSKNQTSKHLRRIIEKIDVAGNEQLDLFLENKTKKTGYIREMQKNGFVFLNKKTGLFSLIPYSQVKDIKRSPSLTGSAQLAENPSLKTYWENYFERKLSNTVAGYSYAIYQNGKPIAVGSYGYDKLPELPENKGIPVTPQTRMHIASSSKPITAVALLRALESKNISTDTKIWTLLKPLFSDLEKPGKGVEEITIAQLLSHKSGYEFDYIEPPRIENLYKLFTKPMPNKVGEKYIYSNINYAIAAILIEQVSGQSYEKYVRDEIFRPVGVQDIQLHSENGQAAYIYRIGDPDGVQFTDDFGEKGGAYGWYSTPSEIVKFLGMVRESKYLSKEITEKMFAQKLGWNAVRTPAGMAFRHEGQWSVPGNYGIHTGVAILPDGIDAVLFINTKAGYSASQLLVSAFNENVPIMRGLRNPKDQSQGVVRVETPMHVEEIRCRSDGAKPDSSSSVYLKPIVGKLPLTVKCQGFIGKNPITFVNELNVKR